ncbi:Uu.00g022260.m01.CDS01 [Anthostomella pinea]|uniref:Uu.00g022260.m01.CDS01 n=1 Tax=Anthostomella pinea TaxID=933095 RepID=A0AAI8VZW6_9PEZI|nr:Uu.00g022260.m01.CDS01 [Anthostomella pinea]
MADNTTAGIWDITLEFARKRKRAAEDADTSSGDDVADAELPSHGHSRPTYIGKGGKPLKVGGFELEIHARREPIGVARDDTIDLECYVKKIEASIVAPKREDDSDDDDDDNGIVIGRVEAHVVQVGRIIADWPTEKYVTITRQSLQACSKPFKKDEDGSHSIPALEEYSLGDILYINTVRLLPKYRGLL